MANYFPNQDEVRDERLRGAPDQKHFTAAGEGIKIVLERSEGNRRILLNDRRSQENNSIERLNKSTTGLNSGDQSPFLATGKSRYKRRRKPAKMPEDAPSTGNWSVV